jgi:hypothetical protein
MTKHLQLQDELIKYPIEVKFEIFRLFIICIFTLVPGCNLRGLFGGLAVKPRCSVNSKAAYSHSDSVLFQMLPMVTIHTIMVTILMTLLKIEYNHMCTSG